MEPTPIDHVARIMGGDLICPDKADIARNAEHDAIDIESVHVTSVSIHSGRIASGSIFFALPGQHTDGHRHVHDALRNGAVGAVVAAGRTDELGATLGPLIVVADPLRALQELAGWWRGRVRATIVAVVGSRGKTVTKDAIVELAGARRTVYGSPGSYNSQLGVALSLLECPADVDLAIIEAAATEPGEMARLRHMVRPDHVVLTNVDSRHQQAFGDREAYASDLVSIGESLPPAGWFLLGGPDPLVRDAARGAAPARVAVCGAEPDLPRFDVCDRLSHGLVVGIQVGTDTRHEILVRTPSEDVLADVELALSAAVLLGVEVESLVGALADYVPTSTRTEMWRSPSGFAVIGDVATTDPLTLASGVRAASRLRSMSGGALYVVLADPLPGASGDSPYQLAEVIARAGADVVLGLDAPAHHALMAGVSMIHPGCRTRICGGTDEIRESLLAELTANDVVLVQAPRGTATPQGWVRLVEPLAPTRLYVDQAAIESNVAAFRRLIGARTRLLGVVKAQAYGTNPAQVALCLQESGADWLGVATTEEGVALRRSGIHPPILVFLAAPSDIERMVARQLTPLVYSRDMLAAVLAHAARVERPFGIHLEVDSGMHRTGLSLADASEALHQIRHERGLRLDGLMTHLACAEDPDEDALTREQLARFHKVSTIVDELGFEGVIKHAAATSGAIRFPEARFDMVRVGIGLYGIQLSAATRAGISLTPAISLVSRVIEVHEIGQGERVGYGGQFRAPVDGARVGVVPAGYFDCVPRSFTKQRRVWVDGTQCPIVGNVSMDSMTVDLTGAPMATVGSDVLIYGQHSGAVMPIEEAAANIDTVPYELLTRVGPRVQRIFTQH